MAKTDEDKVNVSTLEIFYGDVPDDRSSNVEQLFINMSLRNITESNNIAFTKTYAHCIRIAINQFFFFFFHLMIVKKEIFVSYVASLQLKCMLHENT